MTWLQLVPKRQGVQIALNDCHISALYEARELKTEGRRQQVDGLPPLAVQIPSQAFRIFM